MNTRLQPLQDWDSAVARQIKLVASDMDGTMTRRGHISIDLLLAYEQLINHRKQLLLVTGRAAGWVHCLACYLPVSGAIAENGGVFFSKQGQCIPLISLPHGIDAHRLALRDMFEKIRKEYPFVEESFDNRFRLTDWTFELTGLTRENLLHIEAMCADSGFDFTYSTVQCHILPHGQNKAFGILQVLERGFVQDVQTVQEIVTIGDSPNDAAMFAEDSFPFSVGVRNVLEFQHEMKALPRFVTLGYEAWGFRELVEKICEC